jgi:predicted nucleotide-binding protein
MARTTTKAPLIFPQKVLTSDQIERGIARLQDRINELMAFDLGSVPKGPSAELTAMSAAISDTLERCFGENTSAAGRFVSAITRQFRPVAVGPNYPLQHHYQEGAQTNIARSVALLQEAQRTLREDLADVEHMPVLPSRPTTKPTNKVFVVHGHDETAKEGLARFLEKMELEAVILHEQPNQGRTIIEKFEEYAGQVGFAVVLLTPDDLGGSKIDTSQNARARQNVVFELGYFAGKLGRGKACLLRKGDVEIPFDLYGVIYTELDPAEGWKVKLVKEMKAAGLAFDANKVWE